MNISELKVGQGSIYTEGVITSIGEVKIFERLGKEQKVANAVLEDPSGKIILKLWNDDIERFRVGNKVKITNGYVTEFQGEKQLSAGKFGSIEKEEIEEKSEPSEEFPDY